MNLLRLKSVWMGLLLSLLANSVSAETVFIEAETMQSSSSGWVATSNDQTGRASRTKTLWCADGAADAVASKTVRLSEAGRYRMWVRYMQVGAWRGPFQLAVSAGDKQLAAKTFDLTVQPGVADWEYTWQSFDADPPAGEVTLSLTKHEQKNSVGYVRHVDCVLLTSDQKLVPDHLPFGPQTLVRVTMGEGYDRPVYLHLFADHYRSPWYAHYALGHDGIRAELAPPAEQMLKSGDVTPWCNLTPTVYQDSGAALNLSVRHSYHEKAARFNAKLEFGRRRSRRAPQLGESQSELQSSSATEVEVIKTFDVEATPNGLLVIAPPDLESPQNIARLKRDREFADEIGKLADAFEWPKHGRKPVKIPFLVSANIGGYELPVDAAVTAREQKTLDYFGFNGAHERILHGAWHMRNDSYCSPDLAVMRERVKHDVELFKKSGRRIEDIAACMLMDEPTGQAASFMANDEAYREQFCEWLKAKSLKPVDLLVASWDAVRPVAESERDQFPAPHYFTQLFHTRAIGDFMATQRRIIEEAYGVSGKALPFLVNFSDGAVYHANFCGQGIDYFELLDRSHNPCVSSTGIRDRLLTPIHTAKLTPSLTCDTPLIDAVELRCEQGVLLALSNHTLKPLDRIELRLKAEKPVTRAESVRLGPIPFERLDDGSIRIALALAATDFVTLSTQADVPNKGLKLGKLRVGKILFLGNSITLHGPAPQIGWTGNWGMAASAEDKDYVHLLTSQIAKAVGGKPEIKIKNIADFERRLTDYKLADELKEELAFEADVVIIALGENASSPKTDEAKAQFETAFANLFAELKKHGQPGLFVRSQFWQDADKDRLMQKTCEAAGGTFLDISKLGFEETNYARAERKIEHAGVAGHPGDKGMKALADALWNAIHKQAVAE